MATSILAPAHNAHVEALANAFGSATKPIEWLVIAHNDPQVLNALEPAFQEHTAAILAVSQDTWDFASAELPEAIDWALGQAEIKNILLVGSSQAGGSNSKAKLVDPVVNAQPTTAYTSVLDGVQQTIAQNRQAKVRLASQIQQLTKLPSIYSRQLASELEVHGLFYRAADGVFLTYDIEQGCFRACVN